MELTTIDNVPFKYTNMGKNIDEIITSCISIFYALPALFIVIRLGVLYYRGTLNGSFHKLVLIFGINDVFNYVSQLVTLRLPYWGLLTVYENIMVGPVPTALFYVMFTSSYFQVYGSVLMAMNRASSVFLAYRYERVWNMIGWALVLLGPLAAQLLTYKIILVGAQYYKVGPGVYLIACGGSDYVSGYSEFGYQMGYVMIGGCTLAFCINVYTGTVLYHRMRALRTKVQVKDVKFFHLCVITFFCQVLLTIKYLVVHYAEPLSALQLAGFAVGPTITDLNCFIPLYALLILSKDMRRLIVPSFTPVRKQSIWATDIKMVSVTPSRHKIPGKNMF